MPGRKVKNVNVNSAHMSKEQKQKRLQVEETLKNGEAEIKPSNRLNSNQKKIFNYIVSELKPSAILGNLDTFLLEAGAIAIDRLQAIEKEINRDFSMIYNRELMAAKTKYSNEFFKCCEQLALSPQSRAKFGVLALNQKMEEEDPLLNILQGGKK